jgi:DNA end-binding protein Ku
LFTKEELEEIEPESAQTMEILNFVKAAEIDPVYFESSYYAAPEEAGVRAYYLLLHAMRKTGFSAIAKVTMHGRELIVSGLSWFQCVALAVATRAPPTICAAANIRSGN